MLPQAGDLSKPEELPMLPKAEDFPMLPVAVDLPKVEVVSEEQSPNDVQMDEQSTIADARST